MSLQRSPKQLAKLIDYILSRRPDEFGLVPDKDGYVKIKDLLKAVHAWIHDHIQDQNIHRGLADVLNCLLAAGNGIHLITQAFKHECSQISLLLYVIHDEDGRSNIRASANIKSEVVGKVDHDVAAEDRIERAAQRPTTDQIQLTESDHVAQRIDAVIAPGAAGTP